MDEKNDLRTRLIRQAMLLLDEQPDELTLRGVARAAGVSAMAPYRHFADKAALMNTVKESGFASLREVLIEADRAENDQAALVAQGLAYIAFAVAHPALFRLMFTDPKLDALSEPPSGDTAYGVLAGRIAKLLPDRAATAVTAAWAMVHGLATLTLDGRLSRDSGHARAVLDLFVDGLGRAGQH
ncbi:TetR/AcrR family transcriptional regulator [Lichenihabitans psoromatis]|uniref:TetR/AcrR family transcriptional regulator n=1 Tax=Lichenihabitans psoromatis TaxID=2528642 RepID=UPI00103561BF|nr:TetR/AcrR family transcriptional regulator [Lichenihabitans psoromatis]